MPLLLESNYQECLLLSKDVGRRPSGLDEEDLPCAETEEFSSVKEN